MKYSKSLYAYAVREILDDKPIFACHGNEKNKGRGEKSGTARSREPKVWPHAIKAQRTASKTRNTICEISVHRPLTTSSCVLAFRTDENFQAPRGRSNKSVKVLLPFSVEKERCTTGRHYQMFRFEIIPSGGNFNCTFAPATVARYFSLRRDFKGTKKNMRETFSLLATPVQLIH